MEEFGGFEYDAGMDFGGQDDFGGMQDMIQYEESKVEEGKKTERRTVQTFEKVKTLLSNQSNSDKEAPFIDIATHLAKDEGKEKASKTTVVSAFIDMLILQQESKVMLSKKAEEEKLMVKLASF